MFLMIWGACNDESRDIAHRMEVCILCQIVCVSQLKLKLANVSTSIGIRKKNLRQCLVHLTYVNSIKPFFHLNVNKQC